MALSLPDLPYAKDALAPHVSAETLDFHHGKHHQKYVDVANEMIAGTDLANASLEEIVRAAHKSGNQGLFNNAAQIWNHNVYWLSMSPNGGGEPKAGSKVAAAIKDSFGSYGEFADAFKKAGATQFGSGWAWLVHKGGKLEVRKTPNAECPLTDDGATTLLTMDVWEHAYYLDYQNKRPDYMEHWLSHLANWDYAEQQLASV
ncbi:superoxide dismutase [Parvularcula marina]|uniref:superoxide dismutase n=1 Tax=Parvularcula marina TaxID=2292771 RepID=UPI00351722AF